MQAFVIVLAAVLAVAHGGILSPFAPLGRTTVVSGPSGQIVASENLGGAALAYSAPLLAHSAPILAHAAPLLAPAPVLAHASPLLLAGDRSIISLPRGQGIEGAWIPDINEKLYDDGSYKGEFY